MITLHKYHQRIILELLETLSETTDEAKRMSSANLLADCQDGAIEIGNLIEQLEGEGHVTIRLLEEYCELLYHASQELTDGVNRSKIFKKLNRQLISITNSVKNDIKVKLEMVFFPYKASMFDAFESIWLAAKDDPDCETYIVPIPFYDKNPDGTLGQVYYEGDLYPDDVPVIDYKSYDVEERHPDVIFIHNPYDNGNYVTTVHPDFYAEKLCKLTDKLVYCPYYVANDKIDESFTVLPGTIYAHKTIVQSEIIRKEYIRCYKAFEKENHCVGRFGKAEDKFVALGSPKYDAMINKKRSDFVVPAKWRDLALKPDGSLKKIILYNTSISGLLNGDEGILHKLRYVFASFKENEEVVLLWRPHPLSVSTCKSMRPRLLREYLEIVDDYRREGFGIYDDSPDLHRAMALSDAYYGDWSSLTFMYGVTGKPVMIQYLAYRGECRKIQFNDFTTDGDGNIWGFARKSDGLYRLDFNENKAKFITRSGLTPQNKGVEIERGFRFRRIHIVNDYVICLPVFLNTIFIYNQATGEKIIKELDTDYHLANEIDNRFGIHYSVEFNEKIYCFGYYVKAIVVIDTNDFNVEYDTKLFDCIGQLTATGITMKYPLFMSECSLDGKVTMIMKDCEHLIRYSLVTQEIDFIASDLIVGQSLLASFDGDGFWLLQKEKICKWNYQSNEMDDYYLEMDGIDFSKPAFYSNITDCGEYLLILPSLGDAIIKFDKTRGRFSKYEDLPIPEGEKWKYSFASKYIEDKVFIFAVFNHTIYEIDKLSGSMTAHEFSVDIEGDQRYFADFFEKSDDIIYEWNVGDIANFFAASIHGINEKRKEKFLDYTINKDGTAGKAIYDLVLK